MKVRCLIITFLSIALSYNAEACRKRVVLYGADEGWMRKVKTENTTYVVKDCLDLKGRALTLPLNCILSFDGGYMRNGCVDGTNTNIDAEKKLIFKDVTLTGTWDNKTVYSEWLDFVENERFDNARNFKNLMLLCESDVMTHLYMQEGKFYCSAATGSSNIIVPSNVYWHNSATICQLPTDSPKYGFVLISNSSNVTIDGGVFVGDVQSHLGKDGELGHGIKVAGSSNVVLKNLISQEFWGDGIDLIEGKYVSTIAAGVGICKDIIISNVKCLYNRRQGLSIEAAKNVKVKNSEFAYTGKYKMTSPGAGIDIEPWCKNEEKVGNIRFYNCSVHDNNPKGDFCVESNIQYHVNSAGNIYIPDNRIIIDNCNTGKLYIYGAKTVSIRNCKIDEISRFQYGDAVSIEDCTIERKTDLRPRTGLTLRRCK